MWCELGPVAAAALAADNEPMTEPTPDIEWPKGVVRVDWPKDVALPAEDDDPTAYARILDMEQRLYEQQVDHLRRMDDKLGAMIGWAAAALAGTAAIAAQTNGIGPVHALAIACFLTVVALGAIGRWPLYVAAAHGPEQSLRNLEQHGTAATYAAAALVLHGSGQLVAERTEHRAKWQQRMTVAFVAGSIFLGAATLLRAIGLG